MPTDAILVVLLIAAASLVAFVVFAAVANEWIRALTSGGQVTVFDILGMRLRNNPPRLLIDAYLSLKTQGVEVSIGDVERAYIAHRARVRDSGDLVEAVRRDRR